MKNIDTLGRLADVLREGVHGDMHINDVTELLKRACAILGIDSAIVADSYNAIRKFLPELKTMESSDAKIKEAFNDSVRATFAGKVPPEVHTVEETTAALLGYAVGCEASKIFDKYMSSITEAHLERVRKVLEQDEDDSQPSGEEDTGDKPDQAQA